MSSDLAPIASSSSAYSSSSSSQYSVDAEGHFVPSRSKKKKKMADSDSQLQSVDARRYSFRHKTWRRTSKAAKPIVESLPSTLRLVTWNVDFATPNAKTRLKAALAHLQNEVLMCKGGEKPSPCCILLQEILKDAFRIILDNEWVQQYFIVAPGKPDEWPSGAFYGNVTLTSRTVPVSGVYSLEYESFMYRNALILDVKLSVPPAAARRKAQTKSRFITLRVANTHLESLPSPGARLRTEQLGQVAEALKEEELLGGIVCGDMNAISPSDVGLTGKVGLLDAWKEGKDEEDAFTWGYQPPCDFSPGRLDKILFAPGTGGYTVDQPERVGLALKTEKGQWVSDHFGLSTTIRILEA